ncbi:MAG: hypothetical protein V1719_02605 [Patescibacteria group bacterium]
MKKNTLIITILLIGAIAFFLYVFFTTGDDSTNTNSNSIASNVCKQECGNLICETFIEALCGSESVENCPSDCQYRCNWSDEFCEVEKYHGNGDRINSVQHRIADMVYSGCENDDDCPDERKCTQVSYTIESESAFPCAYDIEDVGIGNSDKVRSCTDPVATETRTGNICITNPR